MKLSRQIAFCIPNLTVRITAFPCKSFVVEESVIFIPVEIHRSRIALKVKEMSSACFSVGFGLVNTKNWL